MSALIAFSWIGIMLLVGMILRAKIPFLANILMPASVIGGVIGFILMNIPAQGLDRMQIESKRRSQHPYQMALPIKQCTENLQSG